ncbi:ABC transporter substrate-binding protein [Anaerotruncus colihominis]|uniref:ABC transporter substrate-binding protein n=1 Tax=Anaerotruncus colihominis TaxID=169435 RepID=UPI0039916BB4
MEEKISLTLACGDYDRTQALLNGLVPIKGIALTCFALEPNETFRRMLGNEEFDVSEMSLSNYVMERSEGNFRFTAIPVFLSRTFRHSSIYVNARAKIREARDLIGKKVGVSEYHSTAALWIRGILQDEYQIDAAEINWVSGGMERPSEGDRMKNFTPPPGVRIEKSGADQCLSGLLRTGKIDALINAGKPSCFDNETVRRLWPDYRRREEDYYRRTGIFPIMHTVVVKTGILEKRPWIAKGLFDAFCEAKKMALEKLNLKGTLPVMLPWAFSEYEEAENFMGKDFWSYGLENNGKVLKTLLRYSYEQGLSKRLMTPEELFPAFE